MKMKLKELVKHIDILGLQKLNVCMIVPLEETSFFWEDKELYKNDTIRFDIANKNWNKKELWDLHAISPKLKDDGTVDIRTVKDCDDEEFTMCKNKYVRELEWVQDANDEEKIYLIIC